MLEDRSIESEKCEECFVDGPHLLLGEMGDGGVEPLGVDCSELLDEDADGASADRDLRSE
jgi:hypothetical protein